jgi:hypothetical protein
MFSSHEHARRAREHVGMEAAGGPALVMEGGR